MKTSTHFLILFTEGVDSMVLVALAIRARAALRPQPHGPPLFSWQ
jgi:hypothetical protein